MSSGDHERAKRFQDLYRTLLTPVALIVTVSGVFLVNMAIFYSKESFLVAYQLLIGFSIIALLASGFLYGVAQTDLEKYRRRLSRWAFGCMMFAAFLSSLVLVPTLFSAMMIPGVSRDLPVMIAALTYLGIGLGITIWFCSSKL